MKEQISKPDIISYRQGESVHTRHVQIKASGRTEQWMGELIFLFLNQFKYPPRPLIILHHFKCIYSNPIFLLSLKQKIFGIYTHGEYPSVSIHPYSMCFCCSPSSPSFICAEITNIMDYGLIRISLNSEKPGHILVTQKEVHCSLTPFFPCGWLHQLQK